MNRSTALDFARSIEHAAEIVTEGTAMFSPEDLAGQYAFDAAREADWGLDSDTLKAHLGFLADAGGQFASSEALKIAEAFAAQHLADAAQE